MNPAYHHNDDPCDSTNCVLCGYVICAFCEFGLDLNSVCWLNRFRALYWYRGRLRISGVAVYNHNRSTHDIPLDYNSDGNPANQGDGHYDIYGNFIPPGGVDTVQLGDASARFIFHEACWSLLEKVYQAQAVPLDRLHRVCASLPFDGVGKFWGQDYDGLLQKDEEAQYPWEEWFVERQNDSKECLLAMQDPLNIPELQHFIRELSLTLALHSQQPMEPGATSHDCFDILPWEIRNEIAYYLTTSDAISLQQAAPSFIPILSNQTFWIPRFELDAKRPWLHEANEFKEPHYDRWIYNLDQFGYPFLPALRNGNRILRLAGRLKNMTNLHLSSEAKSVDVEVTARYWEKVSGILVDYKCHPPERYSLSDSCSHSFTAVKQIPPALVRICFSVVQLGTATYISGMRFVAANDMVVELGYRSEGNEVSRDVKSLEGFIVAAGRCGIHALQVVHDNGRVSKWVGSPEDSPITKRLAGRRSTAAIEAEFDNFKMISISLDAQMPDPSLRRALLETALWFPSAPPPHLSMRSLHLTSHKPFPSSYAPYTYALFDGPHGTYLPLLTGLNVTWLSRSLWTIDFQYKYSDPSIIPSSCSRLGRVKDNCELTPRETYFDIDGPGGEVINAVEVGRWDGQKPVYDEDHPDRFLEIPKSPNRAAYLKIYTNLGRSCTIFRSPDRFGDHGFLTDRMDKFVAPAGAAITGFFGARHPWYGFVKLEVLTEEIFEYPSS